MTLTAANAAVTISLSDDRYALNMLEKLKKDASTEPSLFGMDRSLDLTDDYGCWCRPRADFQHTWGKPVDGYDRVCREYIQGLVCLQMDMPSCDVGGLDWSDSYTVTPLLSGGFEVSCVTSGSTCGYNMCQIYIKNLKAQIEARYVTSPSAYDNNNSFGGGFDITTCVDSTLSTHAGLAGDKMCCGVIPDRIPYKATATRSCCAASGIVYESVLNTCCPDGSIQAIGLC